MPTIITARTKLLPDGTFRFICGATTCPGLLGNCSGELPGRSDATPTSVRSLFRVTETTMGFRLHHPRGYVEEARNGRTGEFWPIVYRVIPPRPDPAVDSRGYQRKHRRPHSWTGKMEVTGVQPGIGSIIICPKCGRWNKADLPFDPYPYA